MAYVGGAQASACIFCEKIGERRDEENLIVFRGRQAFVLLNLFPYNSGHLMVAPYVHSGELASLPASAGHDLWSLTQRAIAALGEEYRPDGYNVGMNLGAVAGAGVPDHLHIHVVPRWNGDTNFMPVTAETKVLPETLDQTLRRLRPRFQQ